MRPLRFRQMMWVTATTLLATGGMVACSGESTPDPIGQGGSSGSTANGGSSGSSGNGGSSGSFAGSSNGGTSSGGTSNGGTSNGGSSNGGTSNNNAGSTGDDPDAGSEPDSGTEPEPDAGSDPEPDAGGDPDPDPVNLVTNFNVEAGTIAPWVAAQGGTIAIATDQFNSGAQSAVTVGRDQTYEGIGVNLFGLVEHDKQYDASVFMRVSAPSTNVGRFTAVANCNGTNSYRMITQAAVSDSAWTELSGTLDMWTEEECPNMTSVLLFVENVDETVQVYADDMVVIEQAE